MTESKYGITQGRRVSPHDLCCVVSNSGPNGEPLACAYAPGHQGIHSWGTLPTPQTQVGRMHNDPRERMESRNVRARARAAGQDPNAEPQHVGPPGMAV